MRLKKLKAESTKPMSYDLAIGFYLQAIRIPQPWLNAIVPAVAFMLSTLTLPFFKKLWMKFICRR